MVIKDYSKRILKFKKYLNNFKEIKKIEWGGSTKTKSWDEYSDIDIYIYVSKSDYNNTLKIVPKLLSWWGEIKMIGQYPDCNEMYAYTGSEFLKVEIEVRALEDKRPTENKKNKKSIEKWATFLRDWTIYISRHYGRGQKFSAFYEVLDLNKEIIQYLAEARGYTYYNFIRNAEKLLNKKEKEFLEKLDIIKKDKKSLGNYIINVWKFMDYIDDAWEKKNQKKLNLKINKKEILKMILQTIKW